MKMSRKNILRIIVLIYAFFISASVFTTVNVFAEGTGWGGGDSGSHSPGSGGGSGGGSGQCSNYNGKIGSGLSAGCMGYSWIYFKATGPTKVVNGETVGEEIYFRPYLPYGGVSNPYISGICAGSDKKGNRLGFWHLGRNASAYGSGGYFNTDNHWENGKNGEEVAWGKNDKNGMFPYAFRLYSTSKTCTKADHVCTLGHMATWSYNYINGKYSYKWKKSDFGNKNGRGQLIGSLPYRVERAFDGDTAIAGVSGSYVNGGQKLYKKINGVNVEIYSSYRIASAEEVFEMYKEAYRIQNGGEAIYTGSWFPGDLYAFCSWEFLPKYTLTVRAVDENRNSLSSVSGLENRNSGEVKEKTTASVTRGTNNQYIFLGWKTVLNSNTYVTTTDTNQASYVSGSANPKETFNIKAIDSDATVYAVYRKVSLTVQSITESGSSLASVSGLENKTASTLTPGGLASVTRGTNNQYLFVGWRMNKDDQNYVRATSSSEANYISNSGATLNIKNINSEMTVYAVYRRVSLVAKSIDEAGNSLSSKAGLEDKSPSTLTPGGLASVTRGENDRYLFMGWRMNINDSNYVTSTNSGEAQYITNSGNTLNIKSINSAMTVYAVYKEKSSFKGQIIVTGASGSASVGYTDKSESKVYNVNNCTASGCQVTFTHNLQRETGGEGVSYTISRTSNYWHDGIGVEPKNNLKSGTEKFASSPVKEYEETLTLVPGQVVCEKISFKPYVEKTETADLELCASALGNAQPDDPNPDPVDTPDTTGTPNDENSKSNAFIKMQVKNPVGPAKYRNFQNAVYARPGQTVVYRSTYNPILQYAYYLIPQKMRINGGSIYPAGNTINTASYLYQLYNSNKGSLGNWNNAITVSSTNFRISFNNNYKYSLGDSKKKTETNDHPVEVSEVGKELIETAKTNVNNDTKTTPSQIVFSNDSSQRNVGNVITANKSSSARAYVPYNYDTSISVTTDKTVIDAGEDVTITYEIGVEPRTNPETSSGSDKYATKIPNAISEVIVYVPINGVKPAISEYGYGSEQDVCNYFGLTRSTAEGSNCKEISKRTVTLNNSGALNGGDPVRFAPSIETSDVPAGTSLCAAVAVYPSNSGSYTNWSDMEGNHKWRISESKCFMTGKNPTFQVWGGSFYGDKNVATAVTAKNNLTGITQLDNGVIVFGSWVEQSVVANGFVSGLASGAASGLSLNEVGGGSLEKPKDNFCKYRVPLSLANYTKTTIVQLCSNNGTGQMTGYSGITVSNDKEAMVSSLPGETIYNYTAAGDEVVDFNRDGASIRHIKSNGNLTISGVGNINKTHVVKASGNVNITGNISYENSRNASYTTLSQIPKLVIYAGGDINISCNVTNIDAVLIAKGTVNSCANNNGVSPDVNARERSRQLMINGAIMTRFLKFERTFGMSTGYYSKIPAEIVNYDTSLVLWGRGKTETEDYGKTYQVYSHELAPRY